MFGKTLPHRCVHYRAGNPIRVTQKIPAVADQSVEVISVQEKLLYASRTCRCKWFQQQSCQCFKKFLAMHAVFIASSEQSARLFVCYGGPDPRQGLRLEPRAI